MRVRDDFRGRRRQPGPPPRARADGRRRPRRARELPLRRARRPRRRDRRRPSCSGVLENLWRDVVDTKLYVTGGCGALYDGASPDGDPWQEEISRVHQAYGRAYQLPAHHRARRVVREHRHDPVGRADAGAHRRRDATPTSSSRSPSTPAGEHQPGRHPSTSTRTRCARCATCPIRCAVPGDTGQHPVPAAPAVGRAAARALPQLLLLPAEHRAHARPVPRARGIGVAATACTSTCTAAASIRRRRPRTAARSRCARTSDYPWDGRIAFTVTEAAGGGMPLHLRIPGWSTDATLTVNGEPVRRSRPGHLRPHRARVAARATSSCSTCRCRCGCCVPTGSPRRRRTRSRCSADPSSTRSRAPTCPTASRLEQAALRRGAPLTPVEAEIAGTRVVALEGEIAVLPRRRRGASTTTWPPPRSAPRPSGSSPTSRGATADPAEMSVWLPVVW